MELWLHMDSLPSAVNKLGRVHYIGSSKTDVRTLTDHTGNVVQIPYIILQRSLKTVLILYNVLKLLSASRKTEYLTRMEQTSDIGRPYILSTPYYW